MVNATAAHVVAALVICSLGLGCGSTNPAGPDAGSAVKELCGNGLDDDGNGRIDCADPACLRDRACATCGDGVASGAEECDGPDLRGLSCVSLGFTAGVLRCHPACVLDVRGCALTELCANGKDDDGNKLIDCADPACADDPACAVCGDGAVTGGEQCDDGNAVTGDCCDHCRAEPGCEVERNDGVATAAALALDAGGQGEVRGWLRGASDRDVFLVPIPVGHTANLRAALHLVDGQCPATRLEILDAAQRVVAVLDSPSTMGEPAGDVCGAIGADGLEAGAAAVRISHAPRVTADTPYRLLVAMEPAVCGDGVLQDGQECDDTNAVSGDGCSPGCRLEDTVKTRPDDQFVAAGGPYEPPFAIDGTLDVEGAARDDDWFAVRITRPANLKLALLALDGATCASGAPGSLGMDLSYVSAELGVPFVTPATTTQELCRERMSTVITEPLPGAPRMLAAGIYYVRVFGVPGQRYRLVVGYDTLCGNGRVEPPEACDGGAGCDDGCQLVPVCGNGVIERGEACDDGNTTSGDGCSASCQPDGCGNGRLEPGEMCDDGNVEPGDCCSPTCAIEPGCEREPNDVRELASGPYSPEVALRGALDGRGRPSPEPDVDWFALFVPFTADVLLTTAPATTATPCTGFPGMSLRVVNASPFAGTPDTVATADDQGCVTQRLTVIGFGSYSVAIEGPASPLPAKYTVNVSFESRCMDGAITGTETCDDFSPACVASACGHVKCGDGVVTPPETCDDGNTRDGDGCPADCGVGGGGVCGDGKLDPGEACDDGNVTPGDGCSASCTLEPAAVCGDRVLAPPAEECDDGNLVDGDGCDSACRLEPGHVAEHEPNDDGTPSVGNSDFSVASTDGPFTADVVIHASIAPFGDDDVYAVSNVTGAPITVVAETFAPVVGACDIDTELRVRDELAGLHGFDDDSGLGRCSRLEVALEPGQTRYVQVTDAHDNSLIGLYLLKLSFE